MKRICRWSVETVSRMLQPDERAAVLGDFAELGMSGEQALRELLGLVIRRQATLWKEWGPWLALFGLVAPLGFLFSLISRWWAEGSSIYAFIYFDNWTWYYLQSPGARRDLANTITRFFLDYLTLIIWSWTSGFVLGLLSRRAVWVNGVLFCLVLFGGTLGTTTPARNPMNDSVFSMPFYGVVFPHLLRTALVVVPLLWGMYKGSRVTTLPLLPTALWAVAIVTMTVRAARSLAYSVLFTWWQWQGTPSFSPPLLVQQQWPLLLIAIAMIWPVGYMVALASWRRWRGRTNSV